MNKKNISWKEAFMASPGPESIKESVILSLKGLCMGTADIIPGVSGGTIALITGIYEKLLMAIKSINIIVLKRLFRFDIKGSLSEIHIRFLLSLFFGIGIAIISLARIMNYLIHNEALLVTSLFLGLIAASIFVVGRKVEYWMGSGGISFIIGTILSYCIVGLIPVVTPEEHWFILLSGFVAICAMILPGLSGAFILLILGKYEFITGTLKNPFDIENFITILIFCTGCLGGLMGFSRVLNFLLSRWHNLTLSFLTGLMAGSMRKIWPWKEVLEKVMIRGEMHVVREQNILPGEYGWGFWSAAGLIITGFIAVIVIERLSNKEKY